uniref:Uncharacterized protein n=1 Tax=Amphimedon queenslandica TaxID=400682 RepID=A0A1X7VXT8_AMPQE
MRMLSSTWYNCKGPIWLKEKENHKKKQQKKRMKMCKALNKGFEPLDTNKDMKVLTQWRCGGKNVTSSKEYSLDVSRGTEFISN